MKKYIKPEVARYEVNTLNMLTTSVNLSTDPADKDYVGGGDARRHETFDDDDLF